MPLYPLPELTILKVSGEDAVTFLQGQLTNDVTLLNSSDGKANWQYAGYCNPKGRLLALFKVWKKADDFFLLVPKELVESIKKRLSMFVMRSKVTIDLANETSIYGVLNLACLVSINQNIASNIQPTANNVIFHDDATSLQIGKQYIYIANKEISNVDINKTDDNWKTELIKQGHPQVYADSSELFIPQMLNLDLLKGINFKKGCYTGQEIVARMHYLGKVKQRLFVLTNNNGSEISIGNKIYADNQQLKSVGSIVDFNKNFDHCLAVLRLEAVNSPIYLDNGDSLALNPNEQPFDLTQLSTETNK